MSVPERKRRTERFHTAPVEPVRDVSYTAEQQPLSPDVIATNTGVRLTCTMAAMIGLLGIFLCWAEKESRVIRRFAVQSAALTALHAIVGAVCLLAGLLLSGVPFLNLVVTLMCWLVYIAVLIVLVFLRIRLMEAAWHGVRYVLPAPVERLVERYY